MAKELKDFLVGVENASQVEAIIKENMKNDKCKLFIDDGKENIFVPIARLNAKIGELATANDTITSLNDSLTKLKTQVEGNDPKAQDKIKELEDKIGTYETQVKELKINSAIELLGLENNAKDAKDLKAFVDMSKVVVDSKGEVTGLKEQVEALKESKKYLFNEAAPEGDPQPNNQIPFFGPGFIGKPDNSFVFGSNNTKEGSFGAALFDSNNQAQIDPNKSPIDPDYFFNK